MRRGNVTLESRSVHTHVHTHTHTSYIRTHTYMHTYIHTYIQTHTYTCTGDTPHQCTLVINHDKVTKGLSI